MLYGVPPQPTSDRLPPAPVAKTNTFQEYDKSNAPARAQIDSLFAKAGDNFASAMSDPMAGFLVPLSGMGKLGAQEKVQTLKDLQRVMGLSKEEGAALLNKEYRLLPQAPAAPRGTYGLQGW